MAEDQPYQSIEDHNDEVLESQENVQHLIEEDYTNEVDGDYSEEEEEELDYEYDEEEEDESEDEEEEEGLVIEDSENGVETASLCGDEENAGGGGFNRGEIDGLVCPICMEAWTNGGDHQVCCLPCGHIYGLSCIKTWIQRNRSSRKCPQCNQKCVLKDVRVLYASRIVAADEELRKKVISLEAKFASLEKKLFREEKLGSTGKTIIGTHTRHSRAGQEEVLGNLDQQLTSIFQRSEERFDALEEHARRLQRHTRRLEKMLKALCDASTIPPEVYALDDEE